MSAEPTEKTLCYAVSRIICVAPLPSPMQLLRKWQIWQLKAFFSYTNQCLATLCSRLGCLDSFLTSSISPGIHFFDKLNLLKHNSTAASRSASVHGMHFELRRTNDVNHKPLTTQRTEQCYSRIHWQTKRISVPLYFFFAASQAVELVSKNATYDWNGIEFFICIFIKEAEWVVRVNAFGYMSLAHTLQYYYIWNWCDVGQINRKKMCSTMSGN